ncbi:pyridoxine 5-phosphate synthase [Methylacidimicrobium cyclopophantes]|uniref:Pyridoxine 5'-phosphate synthase n=1 Tax=Methylacidimicrobium cyclopophantes TaxID=1041766 RepID=A0A5E6MPP9_9BACT|nr:pyridoxine 5'-phosphate synthase [Methylacidimicrobium cyclopophantes]VVM07439.1 pyridoxine 5-phosphate synthase [Methylacidimicrobium cyclopophantes]
MASLGVNIDHVATLRQARYRANPFSPLAEPDPLEAARLAEDAGAAVVTAHLREDRRHMQPEDVRRIRSVVRRLNLEMAFLPEMISFACQLLPEEVCLVPERREEVTTEGGLNLLGSEERFSSGIARLRSAGILVTAFIDPDPDQVRAAKKAGADCVELHTGGYANAIHPEAEETELAKQAAAAELARSIGLEVHAGHGLTYRNVRRYVARLPQVRTLNIGHSIVSRALWVGWEKAIREMVALAAGE